MVLEKVKIQDDNKRGFKNINKTDFDPKKHKLYKEKTTRTRKSTKAD